MTTILRRREFLKSSAAIVGLGVFGGSVDRIQAMTDDSSQAAFVRFKQQIEAARRRKSDK